jgi:hypothetical protein
MLIKTGIIILFRLYFNFMDCLYLGLGGDYQSDIMRPIKDIQLFFISFQILRVNFVYKLNWKSLPFA